MEKIIEKGKGKEIAEQENGLNKVKQGVFEVVKYSEQEFSVFLDLRNGFDVYGVDKDGYEKDVSGLRLPRCVYKVRSYVEGEGCKPIPNFV